MTAGSYLPKSWARLGCVNLHWLYVILALPLVTISALVVPPFRVPDEQAHFFKAANIAGGRLLESGVDGVANGKVDAGLIEFETIMNQHCPGPVTADEWQQASGIKWAKEGHDWDVSGTSRYSPVLYLAPSAGLAIGRVMNLSVLTSFALGRTFNGLAAVAIICAAIAMSRRGKLFFFALGLLPMAFFMMGSFNQEAGIIAISLLCAALITRTLNPSSNDFFLLAGCVVVLAGARLPLLALGLLLWLPTWRTNKRIGLKVQFATTAICGLLVYGWCALTLRMQGPVRVGPSAAPSIQMIFLREHPLDALAVFWRTVASFDGDWFQMFVGRLGWLDIPLPNAAYVAAGVMILAAAIVCSLEGGSDWRIRSLTAATFCSALVLLVFSFFLAWTPVGSPTVQGIQGRYLFGFVPLLAMIFPQVRIPHPGGIRVLVPVCVALCAVIAVILGIVALYQVEKHYQLALINPQLVAGQT